MSVWEAISKALPEGVFKDNLKMFFYRYLFNRLYALNRQIQWVRLLKDGSVKLKLNNDLVFYASPDPREKPFYEYKYGDLKKMDKLKKLEAFESLCMALVAMFCRNLYQKYYTLKKGDIVVDAGAHIGTFTVMAARVVGKEGRVIAIEPEENNLRFLKKNIEANNLKNVIVIPKGLWSKKGEMKFYLSNLSVSHSLLVPETKKFAVIKVDTLDAILKELGVDKVDFIKINIEGAEIEALKGARKTLKNKNMRFVIEAGHYVNGERTFKTILQQFREMGIQVNVGSEYYYVYH